MATSVLISCTFDDEETSRRVFADFQKMHSAALLNLTGLIWIFVAKDGHLDVTTAPHDAVASESDRDAASFAQILGSLLAAPLLGESVGGTLSAVVDRIAESEHISARGLRKQAGKILEPGKWAVIAYASQVAEPAIRAQLQKDAPQAAFWEIEEATADTLSSDAGVQP
jgi:uncharacterized membrane protein